LTRFGDGYCVLTVFQIPLFSRSPLHTLPPLFINCPNGRDCSIISPFPFAPRRWRLNKILPVPRCVQVFRSALPLVCSRGRLRKSLLFEKSGFLSFLLLFFFFRALFSFSWPHFPLIVVSIASTKHGATVFHPPFCARTTFFFLLATVRLSSRARSISRRFSGNRGFLLVLSSYFHSLPEKSASTRSRPEGPSTPLLSLWLSPRRFSPFSYGAECFFPNWSGQSGLSLCPLLLSLATRRFMCTPRLSTSLWDHGTDSSEGVCFS